MTFRSRPSRLPPPLPLRGRESWSTLPQRGVPRRHLRWRLPRLRRRLRRRRPPPRPLLRPPLPSSSTAEPGRSPYRRGLARRARLLVGFGSALEALMVTVAAVAGPPRRKVSSRRPVWGLRQLQPAAERMIGCWRVLVLWAWQVLVPFRHRPLPRCPHCLFMRVAEAVTTGELATRVVLRRERSSGAETAPPWGVASAAVRRVGGSTSPRPVLWIPRTSPQLSSYTM